jgi:hypothetical protein
LIVQHEKEAVWFLDSLFFGKTGGMSAIFLGCFGEGLEVRFDIAFQPPAVR